MAYLHGPLLVYAENANALRLERYKIHVVM